MLDIDILTPDEAAQILGVSRRTLLRWRREGRIVGYSLTSQTIRFDRREIERALARRVEESADERG